MRYLYNEDEINECRVYGVRLSVYMSTYNSNRQLLEVAYFDEMWFGHYVTGGSTSLIFFNFIQCVIRIRWTDELVKWKQ
jgi:hypothetical protein